jgi:hypothetical protein
VLFLGEDARAPSAEQTDTSESGRAIERERGAEENEMDRRTKTMRIAYDAARHTKHKDRPTHTHAQQQSRPDSSELSGSTAERSVCFVVRRFAFCFLLFAICEWFTL